MLSLYKWDLLPRNLGTIDLSRLLPFCQRYLKRSWLECLSNFLESNSLLALSQCSYRRGLGIYDALLTLSHHLQVALDRDIEGRLVHLDFSATFDGVSDCGLLYKQRSIGVEGQFLSIVSKFFNDRRHRVRLDGKVSASIDVVSGVPQDSVLGPAVVVYIVQLRALSQC